MRTLGSGSGRCRGVRDFHALSSPSTAVGWDSMEGGSLAGLTPDPHCQQRLLESQVYSTGFWQGWVLPCHPGCIRCMPWVHSPLPLHIYMEP